jgi:hypothetical protein
MVKLVKRIPKKAAAGRAAPARRAPAAERDDTEIIALNLPPEKLSPEMQAYFNKCEEKLGFVPNVSQGLRVRYAEAFGLRRDVQRFDAGPVRFKQTRA